MFVGIGGGVLLILDSPDIGLDSRYFNQNWLACCTIIYCTSKGALADWKKGGMGWILLVVFAFIGFRKVVVVVLSLVVGVMVVAAVALVAPSPICRNHLPNFGIPICILGKTP